MFTNFYYITHAQTHNSLKTGCLQQQIANEGMRKLLKTKKTGVVVVPVVVLLVRQIKANV